MLTTSTQAIGASKPAVGSRDGFILSAGGLLWRRDGTRWLLAVIHRPAYDDWSLPKGKLEPGESWEQAALREVREETRTRPRLGSFAGATTYSAPDPKVTLFWHMETEDPGAAGSEADRLEWVAPERAIAVLTYADQRDIVANAERAKSPATPPRVARFYGLRKLFTGRRAADRLDAAIRSNAPLHDMAIHGARALGGADQPWIVAARALMAAAQESLRSGLVHQGWGCLQAANRCLVFGFSPAQLDASALPLRAEAAEKLKGWRAQAIAMILGEDRWSKGAEDDKRTYLFEALTLRDESFQNKYQRIDLLGRQVKVLVLTLALSLVLLAGLVVARGLELGAAPTTLDLYDILTVMAFGAVGGSLSGLLRLSRDPTALRIPEQLSIWVLTLMRPATGAAAAIAAVVLLQAGLLSTALVSGAVMYSLAFASGFSERLVSTTVEKIGGA